MRVFKTKAPRGENLAPPAVWQSRQQLYVLGDEKLPAKHRLTEEECFEHY